MMKPEPMTPEQVEQELDDVGQWLDGMWTTDTPIGLVRSIEAAVNQKWEEMLAKQEAVATSLQVDAYCEAWKKSFLADNPFHSVSVTDDDKKHIRAGLEAAIAAPVVKGSLTVQAETHIRDSAEWDRVNQMQKAEIERLEKELSAVNECLWGTEDDVISLRHQLDDQQAEIERLKEQNYKLATAVGDQNRKLIAEQAKSAGLLEALEKLARLGNGDKYGNSDGSMIARAALGEQK